MQSYVKELEEQRTKAETKVNALDTMQQKSQTMEQQVSIVCVAVVWLRLILTAGRGQGDTWNSATTEREGEANSGDERESEAQGMYTEL